MKVVSAPRDAGLHSPAQGENGTWCQEKKHADQHNGSRNVPAQCALSALQDLDAALAALELRDNDPAEGAECDEVVQASIRVSQHMAQTNVSQKSTVSVMQSFLSRLHTFTTQRRDSAASQAASAAVLQLIVGANHVLCTNISTATVAATWSAALLRALQAGHAPLMSGTHSKEAFEAVDACFLDADDRKNGHQGARVRTPEALPLVERTLSSLHASSASVSVSHGTAVTLAKELSSAVQDLGRARTYQHMPTQQLQQLTCAIKALTSLCLLPQGTPRRSASATDGVLHHVDVAIDAVLDATLKNLTSKRSTSTQSHMLYCSWHVLHASRGLLVRRAHLPDSDVRSRLRSLLIACARAAEPAGTSTLQAERWGWDLRRDAGASEPAESASTAEAVVATAELLADMLAACTIASKSKHAISNPFSPLPSPAMGSTDPEQISALLCLGRMAVLAARAGDKQAASSVASVVLNQISEVLASVDRQGEQCSPRVYACALRTLARCTPYLSELAPWAYERTLSVLLRAYQDPASGLGRLFLRSSVRDFAPGSDPYKGELAYALEDFVAGHAQQPREARLALAQRVLALCSEFGLDNNLDAAARDLVALLPAVAAACGAVPPSVPRRTPSGTVDQLQRSESVMATVEALCAHNSTSVKLFRNVWLYCGLLGLRGDLHAGLRDWAPMARCTRALGRLAASTPVLMYGTGLTKERETQQRVQLEVQPHQAAAGDAGAPDAIVAQLRATLGEHVAVPAKYASNPFLLAIATLEQARAGIGPLQSGPDATSPLVHPLAYAAGVHAKTAERAVYHSLVQSTFRTLVERLTSPECTDPQPLRHLEKLADVLIRVVCLSDQAAEAGSFHRGSDGAYDATAEGLLADLLRRAPSLYYSTACIKSWAAHGGDGEGAGERLCDWLRQAATRAPTHMEHVVQRLTVSCEAALFTAGQLRLTRLVHAVLEGRAASRLEEVSTGNVTAVHDKSLAMGRVEARLRLSSDVAADIAEAAAARGDDGVEERTRAHHDLAALVVTQLRSGHVPVALLETLCALPLARFDGETMRDVVFAWHWIAAESAVVRDALVTHSLPVWEATLQRGLGLFSGPWIEPVAPLTSGDLAGWDAHARDAPTISAIAAHHAWTLFLLEAWHSSRHAAAPAGASGLMLAFLRFFQSVAACKHAVSTHPRARAPLFRLLTLALSLCSHIAKHALPLGADTTAERSTGAALFGDVLDLALRSFEAPQRVFMPEGPAQAEVTANALRAFQHELAALQELTPATCDPCADRAHLLSAFLAHELQLQAILHEPLRQPPGLKRRVRDFATMLRTAWRTSPALAAALASRYGGVKGADAALSALVLEHCGAATVHAWPAGASRYVAAAAAAGGKHAHFGALARWGPTSVAEALLMLAGPSGRAHAVRAYVMRSLSTATDEELAFWLPQMLQALRNDDGSLVTFLVETAARPEHWMFLHKLIWALDTECKPDAAEFNPAVKRSGWAPPQDTGLWAPCSRVKAAVLGRLTPAARAYFAEEHGTFQQVTDISGTLKAVAKDLRRDAIAAAARRIAIPRDDLYLPVDSRKRLVRVLPESGAPMQSAAKTPILLAFDVEALPVESHTVKARGGPLVKQACIFKVGDDCRQDVLALQIFTILRNAFKRAGLPLYLNPYGVLPTGYERGIIQVVPDTKSRAALGEICDGGLYELFQSRYGAPGTRAFEEARHNFIVAQAGYAVASYIVQTKDRHNGNILLDSAGHIVHIDFGFIFEISPGGNLGFERAAFKFSHEMVQLIDPGGQRRSAQYQRFKELCVRGYLAARAAATDVLAVATLMADSGLPCYGRGRPVDNLRSRFMLNKSSAEAAQFMRNAVDGAHNSVTTSFYDYIQVLQQGIPY